MAEKGWTAQLAAAAGVAAGTGAAQLGLGYGLGVVAWPAVATNDDSVWLGSLGWATWIAASATVFGAVVASRLAPRAGGPWRFALAVSAAIGAVVTVALIALPARSAVRIDTFAPETIAAGYAVVGILFGLLIAYWAAMSRPVAANLIATAAWLWALAVAAVVVDLVWHRPTATFLTSWQFAGSGLGARYGTIYWPSSALTLLAALLIGVIAAWPATRRGDLGVGAASSGAVGPLLVAAAFFALAPRLTGALGPLESAYLIAPYAVLAGLAGSATTVGIGRRVAQRRARRAAARVPEQVRSEPRDSAPSEELTPRGAAGRMVTPRSGAPDGGNPIQRRPAEGGITVQKRRLRREPDAEAAAARGKSSAPDDQTAPATGPASAGKEPGPATSGGRSAGPAGGGKPAGPATSGGKPAASEGQKDAAPARKTPAPTARPEPATDRPRPAAKSTGTASVARPPAPRAAAPKASTAAPSPMQPPPVAPDPVQPPPSAPAPVSLPRSTVAPPPSAPPVAKINPPQKAPTKKATRPPAKDE